MVRLIAVPEARRTLLRALVLRNKCGAGLFGNWLSVVVMRVLKQFLVSVGVSRAHPALLLAQAATAAASDFQIVVCDPHKTGDNVGVRALCCCIACSRAPQHGCGRFDACVLG